MIKKINEIAAKIAALTPENKEDLELVRIEYLAKHGVLNKLFDEFKVVTGPEKKEIGKALNELKNLAKSKLSSFSFEKNKKTYNSIVDLTKSVNTNNLGSRHPLALIEEQIISIFSSIGFAISEGPEIEDDWHNFTALNTPLEHPARDMQDTFFIQSNPSVLLRSHTSSVQVRHMEKNSPPIRILSPGRVYRNEAISARAHCLFHQIEGLYIDRSVSFSDLKQTLLYFAKNLFGEKSKIRLRPSYFPFTEPSAEVDIGYEMKDGKIIIGEGNQWLEILGCGMVHPNVLKNVKVDPSKFQGYAFGIGIDRLAMLKYGINDLRAFFDCDYRWLNHFGFDPLDVPTNYRGLSR